MASIAIPVNNSGLVEVDKETHEVMRVTLGADNIPATFPVKKADTVLDYDYQEISGHTFLLPLKAQIIMAADDYMTRNDEEFRLYRKYSATADITFDSDEKTPPPLSEDKTKETTEPKVIKKWVEDVAKKNGKPAPTELPELELKDTIEYEFDLTEGWVKSVTHTRVAKQTAFTQTDIVTLTRKVKE